MVDSILLSRFSIIKIPCKLGHIIANIKNFDICKSAFEKKKNLKYIAVGGMNLF